MNKYVKDISLSQVSHVFKSKICMLRQYKICKYQSIVLKTRITIQQYNCNILLSMQDFPTYELDKISSLILFYSSAVDKLLNFIYIPYVCYADESEIISDSPNVLQYIMYRYTKNHIDTSITILCIAI